MVPEKKLDLSSMEELISDDSSSAEEIRSDKSAINVSNVHLLN